MTDRMAALERVAEAAREMQMWQPDRMTQPSAAYSAWGKLNNALDALRFAPALPAEPVGETVDVRVGLWRNPHNNRLHAEIIDGADDAESGAWKRIATITARVPLPTIPTVAARVEG